MDIDLMHLGLLSVVVGTALFTLLLGGILAYHLEKFAPNKFVGRVALLVYAGGVVLLLVALVATMPASHV
jgi:hypothetical protein